MENKGLLHKQIVDFFVRNFDIRQEKEDDRETIESIKRGVEFKGTNLWVLIFATFIASLGLNMNSTAVIIGAMLISPLMGPIMGFGLGLGTFDFELIKRAFRNFATATVFGIITSTIYFLLTPIDEAQSELLARTQPTVYDVLIAFFGGLAGIVASSTKSKGNVIPGVAIATALMPPLCTAGFGLASGNLYYFFGALYLYFINTVFISLATFLVVRLLKYPKKVFLDKQREKIVTRYVGLIVFFTIVPSLFLSYNLIRSSYFENRVQTFIAEELNFPDTQILSKRVTDTSEEKAVEVVLIGQTVPDASIANARAKMPKYGLKDVRLVVRQGFGQEATDINELKSLLMRDLYKNSEEVLREQTIQLDSLRRRVNAYQSSERLTAELLPEMRVLFPSVVEASCSNTYILRTDTARADTVLLVYLRSETPLREEERAKIKRWLSARVEMENIKLLIE
ncbi:MAG TPA: TIGR00341 family protein [Candidatus Parabacteroides intestinigallinarum]|uniref:TIGR00341 family protein n=1 Tax=Candidatus Parabacteroides intestinigallinarum TaxID=2838722 RepID=A0A9D1XTQ5_9BACT|nr:TIGR00341 family protein [Candidatus Parabacteroides intestinigallinarum]